MSKFAVIVLFGGGPHSSKGRFKGYDEALADAVGLTETLYIPDADFPDGEVRLAFDGDDTVVIIDDCGVPVYVWDRNSTKSVSDFADFNFERFLEPKPDWEIGELIGFQLVSWDGKDIQGTDEDPFGLNRSDVLIGDAVATAMRWSEDKPCFLKEVYYNEDLRFITLVSNLSLQEVLDLHTPSLR
ncbi:hypothetical protein G6L37_00300 [Agrobacterium rubi]|nr:hypothetical protein [Agrobacterium rubi]NTF23829.1 hypothetical protein [Agrobacterium rubi]